MSTNLSTIAFFANVCYFVVHTYLRSFALFACRLSNAVLADTSTFTVFTFRLYPLMHTQERPFTFPASVLDFLMHTIAASATRLALVFLNTVNTQACAAAFDADAFNLFMLTQIFALLFGGFVLSR